MGYAQSKSKNLEQILSGWSEAPMQIFKPFLEKSNPSSSLHGVSKPLKHKPKCGYSEVNKYQYVLNISTFLQSIRPN